MNAQLIIEAIEDFKRQRDANLEIAKLIREGKMKVLLTEQGRQKEEEMYLGFAASFDRGIGIMESALSKIAG